MNINYKSEFDKVLDECSRIALKAYKDTKTHQQKLSDIVDELHQKLILKIDDILSNKDANNFDFSNALNQIINKIGIQTKSSMEDLSQSLLRKKKTVDMFTISLFGRTKAGKSTIREALTKGNGKTIGKGEQRTTREILEYSWKGLRLLDVPGIEAYKGDEDAQVAQDIIDQSDMIIFLTTDDSVQSGEFDKMASLQEINKHFFIVMNVKYNLLEPETGKPYFRKITHFLRKPDKIFDLDRLKEHRNHIHQELKTHLGISHVEVIWIHAQAAFLSTKENINVDSEQLWNLSQMEMLYDRISHEINRYGRHRRVLTFFDSLVHFVDTVEKMLWGEQKLIREQAYLMVEKNKELQRFFNQFIPASNGKIENRLEELFAPFKQWIPVFVEEYMGQEDAQSVLQERLKENSNMIERSMENLLGEVIGELESSLIEFTKQYEYDFKNVIPIQIESKDIGNLKKGQVGKILKWGGVGIGGLSTVAFISAMAGWGAANIWNPVGWISLGASVVASLLSWLFGDYEGKKWQRAKQEAKETILKNIEILERKTKGKYKSWFYNQITKKAKREIFDEVDTFTTGLFSIADILREHAKKIGSLKKTINKHMFFRLLQLEGVPLQLSDIVSVSREQGIASKIIVPSQWYMNGSNLSNLKEICGESVYLISNDQNIRNLVAKVLHHEKISPNQVTLEKRNNKMIAVVKVPDNLKGLVIGKDGVNIRLAQEVCGIKIILK